MERSAEWLRGAVESHINTCNLITSITSATKSHPARQGLMAAGNELHNQLYHYRSLLAAAEDREAFPIPDTLPEVPETRETGESDSIKLAKLIDGMFYCEGGGYDSDDVREGIQKAFEIGVQSAGKTETSEAGESNAAEVLREHGTWHCDESPLKAATAMGADALEFLEWAFKELQPFNGVRVHRLAEKWQGDESFLDYCRTEWKKERRREV